MSQIADRVAETFQTTGTGTVELSGAVTGYRSYVGASSDGDLNLASSVYYVMVDDPNSPTTWEVGEGTVTVGSPDTLTRDVVYSSSNSGSKVSWSSGTKYVICFPPASAFPLLIGGVLPVAAGGTGAQTKEAARANLGVPDNNLSDLGDVATARTNLGISSTVTTKSAAYTAVADDRSKLIRCTAALTISLTAAATLGDGWYVSVQADGGDVTIDPDGSETINAAPTLTVTDGDSVVIRCDGAAFYAETGTTATSSDHGQCRLVRASATQLKLLPQDGNKLIINGEVETIPAAGVAEGNGGIVANTLYYVYAYMSGGSMALNISTNGRTTDATTGVEVNSADASQTLVGMVYTDASAQFTDQSDKRFVRSWFNDPGVTTQNWLDVTTSSTSTAWVRLGDALTVEFISWYGEGVHAAASGTASISVDSTDIYTTLYFDGSKMVGGFAKHNRGGLSGFSSWGHAVQGSAADLSEGYHSVDVRGKVDGGTGSWEYSNAEERFAINAQVLRRG